MKSETGEKNIRLVASLPSRERGLKYSGTARGRTYKNVAPFAGAWIEIMKYGGGRIGGRRRSLRGSVD